MKSSDVDRELRPAGPCVAVSARDGRRDEGELEGARPGTVEVRVLWGREVIRVEQLSPGRGFVVGEEAERVDFHLCAERLGMSRASIASWEGKCPRVVVPPGAIATIACEGVPPRNLREAIGVDGSPAIQGGYPIALPPGASVRMTFGDITIEVTWCRVGRLPRFGLRALLDGHSLATVGSLLAHTALLVGTASLGPSFGVSDDSISDEQRYLIQQFIDSAATKELEAAHSEAPPANDEGGTGTRAKGDEGSLGNPISSRQNGGFAARGDAPVADLARRAALRDAATFGMVGLLDAGAGSAPDAPVAFWGPNEWLGADSPDARGNMWSDAIGDAYGAAGLGLTGVGEGGGGRGVGIGLDAIGTIGRGAGTGSGQGFGPGHGHLARPPRVMVGATHVSGRLPPETIQRIIRQNFGRFRLCYEAGLRSCPNLQGRVVVRFVVGRDGTVSQVSGSGDHVGAEVVSCVARAFYGLSFPQPEGGIVTVKYPIMFTPDG